MELYEEILAHYLSKESAQLVFPNLKLNATQIVELQSYQALQKIKAILNDASLSDFDCFQKIEEIVCVFEDLGSSGGIRHDFG